MSNKKHKILQIGDTVWFDYQDMKFPICGWVKEINQNIAKIVVNKYGINKVICHLDHIYLTKKEYYTAKQITSEKERAVICKEISTIDGLLNFLVKRKMLCKGDASDNEWAAIQDRINESNLMGY